jgi:zinc-binding alcohol dehydrogenase family protein
MKAVAYQASYSIDHPDALIDTILPDPVAQGRDLLVEVKAVSVNPVDTKVRKNSQPENGGWKVLGWDAAGVVRAVGPDVTRFKPGDRVWYAGSILRPGSNTELQLVDERIVGNMPASLDFAAAAAMPLTSLTAWEMLFDRLQVPTGADGKGKSILIVGAAGGVGSIMVQLAKKLTELTVIGTASRSESQEWVKLQGVHQVIDHNQPLSSEMARIGVRQADFIVSLTHTDQHFAQIVEVIAPQGRLGLIDDPAPIDVRLLKRKSVSLHWELMFTRSIFQTDDMNAQQAILSKMAELVDAGTVASTVSDHYGAINATNLKRAHALLESGKSRGKIVLAGF